MSDRARDERLPEECLATGGTSEDSCKDEDESTNVLRKVSSLERSSDRKDNQHNNHLSITSHNDTDKSFSKDKLINAKNKAVNLPEKHINTARKSFHDLVNAPKKAKEIKNTESTKDIASGKIDNQQNEILSKVVPHGIDTSATSEVIPDHASYDTPTISHGKDTPLFDDDRYPGKAKEEDDKATIDRHLKIACRHGAFHLLKKLLAEHYLKLTPDEQGRTPLFEACLAERHDVVKFLVKYGFDVNHQDNEGKTPLHVAAENQLWGVFDFLLDEYKANFKLRDSRNWTPYHHAISWHHKSINPELFIKEFLEQDLGTDRSWLQLHAACETNQLQTVKLLLQHNVDVNRVSSLGITALVIACGMNHGDIVDCLLEYGVDLNIVYKYGHRRFPVLLLAILEGYTSIAMRLIEKGADVKIPDHESLTPLHYAATLNQLDIMRELLNHGADINCRDLGRVTPLHCAATTEMDELLKLLLKYKPELDHRDAVRGFTALHYAVFYMAVRNEYTNNVILLLQHGADPLIKDMKGETPFDYAIDEPEHPEIFKAFIKYRPSIIDTLMSRNMTALHFFCCKGNTDMVKYLLDMGANKDVICYGMLPIDVAFDYVHMNIVEMLIDAGANVTLAPSEMASTFLEEIYIRRHDHMSLLQHMFASEKCVMDLTRRNRKGETFMHQACRDGADKVIHMMLVSKRAEIGLNICNNDSKSPVAILCEQASKLRMDAVFSVSMMAECSGRKLDVNTVDSEMKTPLHRACEADCIFIVNILLHVYGVSPNARDAMGKTPIQYVSPTGNQAIVKLLREFGAETE